MKYRLDGNWKKGLAFDLHTIASNYLGPDEYGRDRWDTTRSEMGELIYRLKYGGDRSAVKRVIELLKAINGIEKFDAIIPVPSTNRNRPYQPVDEIAKELGAERGVEVLTGFLEKEAGGQELKAVGNPTERKVLLKGAIKVAGDTDISRKNVLLIDDLYRSGATLNVAADVLYNSANVRSVCVLTMTKTRSRR
jgi:predicted amidophosphoribosyltransferase